IIELMILPKRFILFMLAIAEEIVKNTRGITTMNSKLIKISQRGLIISAFSPKINPMMDPNKIDNNNIIGKRYAFNLFFIKFSPFRDVIINYHVHSTRKIIN